eukprot:353273-Chlamydomonas_euryale.AAC.13
MSRSEGRWPCMLRVPDMRWRNILNMIGNLLYSTAWFTSWYCKYQGCSKMRQVLMSIIKSDVAMKVVIIVLGRTKSDF